MIKRVTVTFAVIIAMFFPAAARAADKRPAAGPAVIDAVAASVNGKPITLSDVGQRLNPPRPIGIREAGSDPEVRRVLDLMIMEHVIRAESEARKISVNDEDVDRYIAEVARRNSLSVEGFRTAVEREAGSFERYRDQVKNDVLRSKLTSALFQGGVGVSGDEIAKYLEEHPDLSRKGAKIRLSQILLELTARSESEARDMLENAREEINSASDFERLARQLSDGPEAAEGGSLGLISESDLSPAIFDAVFSLKEGEVSEIVVTDRGLHLFRVDERPSDEESSDRAAEDEVRRILEQQKLEQRMQTYFTDELFRKHAVDKKI